jgi:hypothetical protein
VVVGTEYDIEFGDDVWSGCVHVNIGMLVNWAALEDLAGMGGRVNLVGLCVFGLGMVDLAG